MSPIDQESGVKVRFDSIDALRGFALLGVGFAHLLEQYLAAPAPAWISSVANLTLADQIVGGITQTFVVGKFYILFSFLFGLSFFMQIERPFRQREPYVGRFLKRLFFLFLFGWIHHWIYRGDILTTYAVLGVLLLLIHSLSNRNLLIISALLFLGAGKYFSFILPLSSLDAFSADQPSMVNYYEVISSGSLLDLALTNNTGALEGLLAFQYGIFGRGYMTFGLFLLGVMIGRSGLLQNLAENKALIKKTLYFSIAAMVVFSVATGVVFSLLSQPLAFNTWQEAIALSIYDLSSLATSFVYGCSFLLLVQTRVCSRLVKWLAPYGRMALTNYLLQSLIGCFLLYGWGLGLIGQLQNTQLALLAIALALFHIVISRIWMRNFHFGPLEWVWRMATLNQRIPIRRRPEQAELGNLEPAANS